MQRNEYEVGGERECRAERMGEVEGGCEIDSEEDEDEGEWRKWE